MCMKRTRASHSSPIYILWKLFYPGNKRKNALRWCFSISNSSVLRNAPPRVNRGEEHRLLARFKTLPKRVNNRCSFQHKIAGTHYSDNATHLSRRILREMHFDAWLKTYLVLRYLTEKETGQNLVTVKSAVVCSNLFQSHVFRAGFLRFTWHVSYMFYAPRMKGEAKLLTELSWYKDESNRPYSRFGSYQITCQSKHTHHV